MNELKSERINAFIVIAQKIMEISFGLADELIR